MLTASSCSGEDAAGDGPTVVEVAAQPCTTPNRALGRGVVVADGLVVTAAHTVEGDLRELTVDGAPATVVALDVRTDLALLEAPAAGGTPARLSDAAPATGVVLGPGGAQAVDITWTGTLVVDDATAGARHERLVHRFAPDVDGGTSGSPLVDEAGQLLGIVVLTRADDDAGYAVTAAEVETLLAAGTPPTALPTPGDCPGYPG